MTFPKNTKILVVDDMKTMRMVMKKTLGALGYEDVTEADDGDKAWPLIQQASTSGKPFQLILSDWNMPKMKGLDLLKLVRTDAKVKDTPFILVTAESEAEQVKIAISQGVSQYVVKPFTADTLKDKLASITMKKAG